MIRKIRKFIFIPASVLLLISCGGSSGNDTSGGGITWDNVTGFELINAFSSPTRFNILYSKTFSGDVSYIISQADLNITTEIQFNDSSAAKNDVTIIADDLIFNDYIQTDSLGAGTEYHMYLLDKTSGEVKSFVKSTLDNSGSTQETGTITGSTTMNYYINYPSGYDPAASTTYPLILSVKAPNFTQANNNLPCITFSININYSSTPQYNADVEALRQKIKMIIEDSSYRINKSKLYAAGFSAGGCAVMQIANDDGSDQYKFTAIAAVGISGWIGEYYSANLGDTNIWLFWGENDTTYGPETIEAYGFIPQTSGDHLLSELKGIGHADGPVWASPYTFMWLLSK